LAFGLWLLASGFCFSLQFLDGFHSFFQSFHWFPDGFYQFVQFSSILLWFSMFFIVFPGFINHRLFHVFHRFSMFFSSISPWVSSFLSFWGVFHRFSFFHCSHHVFHVIYRFSRWCSSLSWCILSILPWVSSIVSGVFIDVSRRLCLFFHGFHQFVRFFFC
jgi:hypothetical protein